MKVAVLGSGNGGCAVAFDWAQHGHEVGVVRLRAVPANVAAISAQGGIRSSGQLEGFAAIGYAGHDVAQALDGAELVFAVSPAFATEPTAACRRSRTCGPGRPRRLPELVRRQPRLQDRARPWRSTTTRYIVGETSTLPYAVRVTEPG